MKNKNKILLELKKSQNVVKKELQLLFGKNDNEFKRIELEDELYFLNDLIQKIINN